MGYRSEWRYCKSLFPNVYCYAFLDGGYRIVADRGNPRDYMEFYSLGNGNTRIEAWRDAALHVEEVYKSRQTLGSIPRIRQ
jgi:hypothetical protein